MRLSSFFGRSSDVGPVVQSVMHVDARDLTFTETPDGMRLAQAGSGGDDLRRQRPGRRSAENRRYAVRLTAERHAQALQTRSFVYNLRMPVKRPGPSAARRAARCRHGSDRLGQPVHRRAGSRQATADALEPLHPGNRRRRNYRRFGGGRQSGCDARRTQVPPRHTDRYICYAYNVARNSAGKPQVESAIRLLRDGVEVFRSATAAGAGVDGSHELAVGGTLQLGPAMTPGSYLLEISVTDGGARRNPSA